MFTYSVSIFIKPNAKQERLYMEGQQIRAETTSPPVKGAANIALIQLLSGALKIPKSQISIIRGHTSTTKLVRINCEYSTLENIYQKIRNQE